MAGDLSCFIENKNQWPEAVLFQASIPGGDIYLEDDRWTFLVHEYSNEDGHHKIPIGAHAFQQIFLNSENPEIYSTGRSKDYKNYFKGETSKWAHHCYSYSEVLYSGLYDCIDLKLRAHENGLKYDYIIAPGADPSLIRWEYAGTENPILTKDGLLVENSINAMQESNPFAYQMVNGVQQEVACAFEIQNGVVSFNFPDGYDSTKELIIDPKLVFSSYSGSSADNWGTTATFDDMENAFGAGTTFGADYPVTMGVFEEDYQGEVDITITKFDDEGTDVIYSTYLGGDDSEIPHSLIVNSQNQLVVFGTSGSTDFPTTNNAYDTSFNGGNFTSPVGGITFEDGSDIIISVFEPDGSALIGSTFLGGDDNDGLNDDTPLDHNYGDHARGEVIVDGNDNIYIASCTLSDDFPTTSGVFQNNLEGEQEGIVAKFNSDLSTLSWCSFLGGDDNDAAYSVKLGTSGSIYVAGATEGGDFSLSGGINNSYLGGSVDGFVVQISNDGSSLLGGSFIGTNDYDQAYFVEVDKEGDVYLYGHSEGDYPVFGSGVYENNNAKQFIHVLDGDLGATQFSTVFGSTNANEPNISPTAFLVDECNRVYCSGWGGSLLSSSTNNMPTTPDAYQGSSDGGDFYLMVLEEDLQDLIYATYIGSPFDNDHVDGGTCRFDRRGSVYHAVCACNGDDWPTTPFAWSNTNESFNCNMAVFRFDFEQNFAEAASTIDSTSIVNFGTGCINPITGVYNQFFFQGTEISDSLQYYWDFGDGQTSTIPSPIHGYDTPGFYEILLEVTDTLSCNLKDSSFIELEIVNGEPLIADFLFTQGDPCAGDFNVDFSNESTIQGNTYSVSWDFLDIGQFLVDFENPSFEFSGPGEYLVTMVVRDSLPCFVTDTVEYIVSFDLDELVQANFALPENDCAPLSVNLEADDQGPTASYAWDLGNGETASGQNTTVEFENAGSYDISLLVEDPNSCNLMDTEMMSITVFPNYTSSFSASTLIAEAGESISFEYDGDAPLNDAEFSWSLGNGEFPDGPSSVAIYNTDGTFQVCLTVAALNSDCESQTCEDILIDSQTAIGVPNAFSPNGDGQNEIFKVEGFGIVEFDFQIFNRWGNLLFETSDVASGWDGRYKGREQDIGVYVYKVQAVLLGGKTFEKKGNFTLLK